MHEPDPDIQALILGGPEWYTREEMASASRLSMADVARLWRAMGFPDVGEARAFTDADLSALLRVAALVERGPLDMAAVVEVARSLGQTTARLADWQIDSLGRRLHPEEGVQLSNLSGEVIAQEVGELLPELEQLLVYVWRRQIAATLGRGMVYPTPDLSQQSASTATVGFADLVSFTRLSRQLDDKDLGSLVESFESVSADVVHAHGGRLVKTLGDEVMFVAPTAEEAAQISVLLHITHSEDKQVPEIRIGLATGVVLNRMGDVYGTTVNRASRYTAMAKPGTTLVDTATSESLQADPADTRFVVRALTPRPVRGFGIVRPYAVTEKGPD
jgi:adenylate cyclase